MTSELLRQEFGRTFDAQPDLIVRSPGRVNLIGGGQRSIRPGGAGFRQPQVASTASFGSRGQ